METTFSDLTQFTPDQLRVLLDTVMLRINSLEADMHAHVILVGWEEVIQKALKDVMFEKDKLPY